MSKTVLEVVYLTIAEEVCWGHYIVLVVAESYHCIAILWPRLWGHDIKLRPGEASLSLGGGSTGAPVGMEQWA